MHQTRKLFFAPPGISLTKLNYPGLKLQQEASMYTKTCTAFNKFNNTQSNFICMHSICEPNDIFIV